MLITSLITQEIKVSDLWSLENIGVMDDGQAESKKETDQAVMDKFRTETKRLESGRYEVHLPWIEPAQNLKENKSHAKKRLRKMTEDLKKRGFYHHYNKIFEEWEENGIIERIQSDQDDTLEYFLPHRAVVKSGSSTTPLHLEQYENEREIISLLKCMYMDNCVNSVTSLEEAQVFQQQSIDLLSPTGFNLREWQMGGPGIVNGENISLMMTPTYKSLDRVNDAEIENHTHKLSKRIMLSKAHAVFEPLGLFSPFTIVPKIILQQCWKSELKWDQPVPEDIAKKFRGMAESNSRIAVCQDSKQLIQKVLGDKTVSYEELQTVICEVESAMNLRPLTAISEKSGLVPITPAKFMCDNASCLFVPEADIVDSKFLKESHGKVQKLCETIRQRFRKEYLGFLRQNTRNKTKSIKEGDVVLMEVNNKKQTEWSIGVIEKTYLGKDVIVRVAMIKTKRGNFLWPVQRLFFLENSENHSKEDFGKGRDLEKDKKINLDTQSISQRSIRGKDSPVIARSGRIVKPPDRY
ncbi:hypothetical protein LAZ67_12002069 [Cordylochernes scorpioides]|uniref:DUF5641 domain-containing protein n=1 Tax=Cordylochernes scorpioides TaxID=51811 RepID=A0ABY6L1J7_9ARAC|nr:hypothetical protein LAZ67_12002069 [Cordylochernes scorpioides]